MHRGRLAAWTFAAVALPLLALPGARLLAHGGRLRAEARLRALGAAGGPEERAALLAAVVESPAAVEVVLRGVDDPCDVALRAGCARAARAVLGEDLPGVDARGRQVVRLHEAADRDDPLELAAAWLVGGDEDVRQVLTREALERPSAAVRRLALEGLAHLAPDRLDDATALAGMDDADVRVRRVAVRALLRLGPLPRPTRALDAAPAAVRAAALRALDDRDPQVRLAAHRGCGHAGLRGSRREAARALVREALAGEALLRPPTPLVDDALGVLALLPDAAPPEEQARTLVRAHAHGLLERLDDERWAPVLERVVRRVSPEVHDTIELLCRLVLAWARLAPERAAAWLEGPGEHLVAIRALEYGVDAPELLAASCPAPALTRAARAWLARGASLTEARATLAVAALVAGGGAEDAPALEALSAREDLLDVSQRLTVEQAAALARDAVPPGLRAAARQARAGVVDWLEAEEGDGPLDVLNGYGREVAILVCLALARSTTPVPGLLRTMAERELEELGERLPGDVRNEDVWLLAWLLHDAVRAGALEAPRAAAALEPHLVQTDMAVDLLVEPVVPAAAFSAAARARLDLAGGWLPPDAEDGLEELEPARLLLLHAAPPREPAPAARARRWRLACELASAASRLDGTHPAQGLHARVLLGVAALEAALGPDPAAPRPPRVTISRLDGAADPALDEAWRALRKAFDAGVEVAGLELVESAHDVAVDVRLERDGRRVAWSAWVRGHEILDVRARHGAGMLRVTPYGVGTELGRVLAVEARRAAGRGQP